MQARVVQGAVLLGLATAVGFAQHVVEQRREHRGARARWRPVPGDADDLPTVLDEVDEAEPPGIEYDQRLPCPGGTMGPSEGEGGECLHPDDVEPQGVHGVPFAEGAAEPAWPVITRHPQKLQVSYVDLREKWHGKWGREFGASRKSETAKRHHAGVDLFGNEGDTVVAMEDGVVISILKFHHGSWAIYVLNDTGDVVNYGEIEKNSWWPFGIKVGGRVRRGQKIAKLGMMYTDSMLHVETYAAPPDIDQLIDDIRHERLRWVKGDPPPESLLDPTHYLLDAQMAVLRRGAH